MSSYVISVSFDVNIVLPLNDELTDEVLSNCLMVKQSGRHSVFAY